MFDYFMIGIKLGMFGNNSATEMLAFLSVSYQGVHDVELSLLVMLSFITRLSRCLLSFSLCITIFPIVVNILEKKLWD